MDLEAYRSAGRIAAEVRKWSEAFIKPGLDLVDFAEKLESKIRELGGEPAFPVNLCVNDVAAHFTPKLGEAFELRETDVLSVDVGVHVDGWVADVAYTADLSGEHEKLIDACKQALEELISSVKAGKSVADLGRLVEELAEQRGFRPIENLGGHKLERYELHRNFTIPNIGVPYHRRLEEGTVLALEPFLTDGYGKVVEGRRVEIYSLDEPKPARLKEARLLLESVAARRKLPFARRWFQRTIPEAKLNFILADLVAKKVLRSYPVLHEVKGGIVVQFEETVVVEKDGCEVLTRP